MKLLIIGGTSAIAQEAARNFAAAGAEIFLVARNTEKLATLGDDLKVRGAKRVETCILDLDQLDAHQGMVDTAI
jgi:decaprenylphospho-beta-D-erythro-pentofuranosid-2-ulose 2-reductase